MKKRTLISNTFLLLTLLFLIGSTALAEPLNSRWKWCYSIYNEMFYYDTQTIEFNADEKTAKVWELITTGTDKQSKDLTLTVISFKNKTYDLLQCVSYNKHGEPKPGPLAKTSMWTSIPPDTPIEALANSIAAELHIKPVYKGGTDRWKLLRSTNGYKLYVAKDTIVYNPEKAEYSIWTKKIYGNNSEFKALYSVNLSNMTIWRPESIQYRTPQRPIPETDEEYIYNAIKGIAKNF